MSKGDLDTAANASAEARVLPDWMASLPMQQQSVLILALRGPDGIRKHHPCKDIVRYYRGTILKAARFGRLLRADEKADTFMGMQGFSDEATFRQVMDNYFDCIDELPHHYHMHLMHGAEILGYKHPDELYRERWFSFYLSCLKDSHTPQGETERQMDDRLSDWGRKQWESTTLSAHPHASDCDKQGETGMNWQVSDETLRRIEEINENRRNAAINADNIVVGGTAGVTEDQIARVWKSEQNRYEVLAFTGNRPCQVECDGQLAFTGCDEDCETFIRTRCARALLDAYGMWRR